MRGLFGSGERRAERGRRRVAARGAEQRGRSPLQRGERGGGSRGRRAANAAVMGLPPLILCGVN